MYGFSIIILNQTMQYQNTWKEWKWNVLSSFYIQSQVESNIMHKHYHIILMTTHTDEKKEELYTLCTTHDNKQEQV